MVGTGLRLWAELAPRLWRALVVSSFGLDAWVKASREVRHDRRGSRPRLLGGRGVELGLRSWVKARCCRTV